MSYRKRYDVIGGSHSDHKQIYRDCTHEYEQGQLTRSCLNTSHHKCIIDELKPKRDQTTRFCRHFDVKFKRSGADFSYGNRKYPDKYTIVENYGISSTDTPWGQVLQFPETLLPDSMADFNSRAYAVMLPSLERDVNLTNFIIELSDLLTLRRFFGSYSSKHNTIVDALREARIRKEFIASKPNYPKQQAEWERLWQRRHRNAPELGAVLADYPTRVSEGHLLWSFGIKPMINDLQEIWSGLVNAEERIQDFLERRNAPQTHYYREVADLSESSPTWVNGTYSDYSTQWHKLSIVRVARMAYTYDLDDIKSLRDKLRALRDILGLRLTPSVIWNAIPGSFVVDWVAKVGDFLKNRERALLQPDVFITDYSVSYKIQFDWSRRFRSITACEGGDLELETARVTGKHYCRRQAIPETNGSPLSFSSLSDNQLALAASLLNVRVNRSL